MPPLETEQIFRKTSERKKLLNVFECMQYCRNWCDSESSVARQVVQAVCVDVCVDVDDDGEDEDDGTLPLWVRVSDWPL